MVKRNIISGLLLFSISIMLGPYMMRVLPKEERAVQLQTELGEAFGALREAQAALAAPAEPTEDSGERAPEPPTATGDPVEALALATARASRAHVNYYFGSFRRSNFTMTHAHGNLMGIVNILVGLFLAKVAVGARIRLGISWGLIAGSWIMVGALLLGNMFGLRWALQGMIPGGTVFIVSLLALTAAFLWKGTEEEAGSG